MMFLNPPIQTFSLLKAGNSSDTAYQHMRVILMTGAGVGEGLLVLVGLRDGSLLATKVHSPRGTACVM